MSHHPLFLRAASVVPGGRLFTLLIIVSLLLCGCAPEVEPEAGPPNILLAIADDWGFPHAGTYGDPVVKTPTFDRLAREGIVFNQAYISSPSCTPSRAALLTGQWHWRLEESANLWSTLQTKFPVYPDLLEKAGYFSPFHFSIHFSSPFWSDPAPLSSRHGSETQWRARLAPPSDRSSVRAGSPVASGN